MLEGFLLERAELYLRKYFLAKKEDSDHIAYPEIWQPMDGDEMQCHRFDLDPQSLEFKEIEQRFLKTMNGFAVIGV